MIPSNKEVKEAVETLKTMESEITYGEFDGHAKKLSLNIAIKILESYLSAEMPEELDLMKMKFPEQGVAFNEALRLCKLASVKDKARVEELEGALRNVRTCLILANGGFGGKSIVWADVIKDLDNAISHSALANVKQGREG